MAIPVPGKGRSNSGRFASFFVPILKVRSKKSSFQEKFVPNTPLDSYTLIKLKKVRSKMSQPRRASGSPGLSGLEIDTPTKDNKSPWQSPILKPVPRKLLKPFQNAKQKQQADQTLFCSEDGPGTDEEEEDKFAAFAGDWAREDKKRNIQLDHLEALEDLMEVTMNLADRIVRMINKMKKELRAY
jgi:hypothetical protein